MTQLRLLAAAAIHHKVLKKSVFLAMIKTNVGSEELIWKDELHQLNIKQFESPTGPTVPISDKPIDVFELYFDIPLQEKMVAESNKYAKLVMGEEAYRKWDTITVTELRAFFGFAILMGGTQPPAKH